jgi:hypothetical protein
MPSWNPAGFINDFINGFRRPETILTVVAPPLAPVTYAVTVAQELHRATNDFCEMLQDSRPNDMRGDLDLFEPPSSPGAGSSSDPPEIWQQSPDILNSLILAGHVLSNPPSPQYLNNLSDDAFRLFMSQQSHLRLSNIVVGTDLRSGQVFVPLDHHHLALLTRSQLFSAFVNFDNDRPAAGQSPFVYVDDRSSLQATFDALNRQIPSGGEIPQRLLDVAAQIDYIYRRYLRLNHNNVVIRGHISEEEIRQIEEDERNYESFWQDLKRVRLISELRRLSVLSEDIADNAQTAENLDANEFHHPQDFLQTQLETTQDHDWFGMVLLQGNTYTFRMNKLGGNLDTFLTLRDARGNEITHNDDSDGSFNSRITFTAEKSGVYFLDASSYASSYSGSYEIRSNLDVGALKTQGSYTSALSADKKSQLFKIELKAGHKYEFLMNRVSTDTHFDAYLYLRDANKNEITRDDDSGGSLNSKISYTAHSDGVYYLDATSYQQHSVGQFTVVSHQVI